MIQLQLLGGFSLCDDGEAVELRPASQRLIAFLALASASVERAFTAFRLWPDACEERARGNLRSTVWRLRRQHSLLVQSSRTHVWLDEGIWVDVVDGLAEDTVGSTDQVSTKLHEDLLPDWYDDWLEIERERIRQIRLRGLEARSRQALCNGSIGEAVQLALRAVAMDVLRESAHRLVMEAHLAEGNVADAVRQYDHCAKAMESQLGIPPTRELGDLLPARCRSVRQG